MRHKISHWVIAFSLALIIHGSLLVVYKSPPSGAESLGFGGIQASIVQLKNVKQGSSQSAVKEKSSEMSQAAKKIKQPEQPKLPKKAKKPPKKVVKEASKKKPRQPKKRLIAVDESVVKEKLEKKIQLPQQAIEPPKVAKVEDFDDSKVLNISTTSTSSQQNQTELTNNDQIAKFGHAQNKDQGTQAPGGTSEVTSLGGASVVARADYRAILRTILEQNKRYPANARKRRQQGIVRLWFKVSKKGQLLEYKIASSSGFRILDKEVEKLIQRVSPFPEIPDEININELEINVPISFTIK